MKSLLTKAASVLARQPVTWDDLAGKSHPQQLPIYTDDDDDDDAIDEECAVIVLGENENLVEDEDEYDAAEDESNSAIGRAYQDFVNCCHRQDLSFVDALDRVLVSKRHVISNLNILITSTNHSQRISHGRQ